MMAGESLWSVTGIYGSLQFAEISNSTITFNKATSGDGGGIYVNKLVEAKIYDNAFISNSAADDGGGIFIKSNATNTVTNDEGTEWLKESNSDSTSTADIEQGESESGATNTYSGNKSKDSTDTDGADIYYGS